MTAKRNKRENRTGVLQQYKKKHGQKRLKKKHIHTAVISKAYCACGAKQAYVQK